MAKAAFSTCACPPCAKLTKHSLAYPASLYQDRKARPLGGEMTTMHEEENDRGGTVDEPGDSTSESGREKPHANVDASRYAALMPQHTDAMLRVAGALLGWTDAEDAVQEAAMQAWRHWDSLRDLSSLRPWLLRITVNVCRQWRRGTTGREARMRASAIPLNVDGFSDLEFLATLDDSPGTSDFARALDVRRSVNHLPTDMRIVIALRYYAGLDASAIGKALGIPAATVRTRLRRALLALRERLDSPTGTDDTSASRAVEH